MTTFAEWFEARYQGPNDGEDGLRFLLKEAWDAARAEGAEPQAAAWKAIAQQNFSGDAITKYTDALEREVDAKQAQIDNLMLEYCPAAMTREQINEWKERQQLACPEAEAKLKAALSPLAMRQEEPK